MFSSWRAKWFQNSNARFSSFFLVVYYLFLISFSFLNLNIQNNLYVLSWNIYFHFKWGNPINSISFMILIFHFLFQPEQEHTLQFIFCNYHLWKKYKKYKRAVIKIIKINVETTNKWDWINAIIIHIYIWGERTCMI